MSLWQFAARSIEGEEVALSRWEGQVALVVNVASKCGYTPQYAGLEALYRKYRDRGFVVLGFPCNQFGAQEPGTEEEIQTFCSLRYEVSFPMFARIDVNGPEAHPVWEFLKSARPGLLGTEAIKWNFTKFLVGRDGMPRRRHGPRTEPAELDAKIEELLGAAG